MDYPQMERAAVLLLMDQGMPSLGFARVVKKVIENPESIVREDGEPVTLADCAAFETWAASLSDELLDIACCGCDETEPNGPITYTDGSAMGSKGCIFVVIPRECARVLDALFDSLDF